MARSQTRCVMAVETALGKDQMLLRDFRGVEGLSELFSYHLEMDSPDHRIDYSAILGTNVTVRFVTPGGSTRYWNGFIHRFSQTGVSEEGLAVYHADMVPWLWFLTRSADCRIFQKKTAQQIIEAMFSEMGFSDYKFELSDDYPELEYCVQYRETALNFVSRLMEEFGMFYHFAHSNGRHEMVIADSLSRLTPWPDYDEIAFMGPGESVSPGESISSWNAEYQVMSGVFTQRDYNFETPSTDLLAKSSLDRPHVHKGYEIYDYPGRYTDFSEGSRASRVRLEELQWQHAVYDGITSARGVTPGYKFRVKGHPRTPSGSEFLVVSADYHIRPTPGADIHHHEEQYACSFKAIDVAEPFRPPRRTPKPIVEGPQTAVVVGKAGEEIYPDKYGRVVVQFHWDREGKADENSSCWIRVAQLWAGRKWGAMFIPRIGQEVIVEFLEGDPDRPIITGRVYHAQNMPPYDLPDEKTKSTIKSNSSKGGDGFNEIRMEDKKGKEQIFFHAEKDEDIRVKNDAREWIGHDRHLHVEHDQVENVEVDKHLTVKGDRVEKIEGSDNLTVKADRLESVEGSDNLTVKGSLSAKVGADRNLKILGSRTEAVRLNISRTSDKNIYEKAAMDYAMETGMNVHIKAGMSVVIEAGLQLTLKGPGGFVTIDPGGVSISGTTVKINSGGAAGLGMGSKPDDPTLPSPPDVPKPPDIADNAVSGEVTGASASPVVDRKKESAAQVKVGEYSSPAAMVLKQAAQDGTPFCEQCERAKQ